MIKSITIRMSEREFMRLSKSARALGLKPGGYVKMSTLERMSEPKLRVIEISELLQVLNKQSIDGV